MKRVKAIYPGSFDPPTNGHLDLIERGSKIFDELVVAILRNPEKDPLFSVTDRRQMLSDDRRFDNVSIDTFDGLDGGLCRCALTQRAILRGIRAISDYEYELQMALMNRKLQPGSRPFHDAGGKVFVSEFAAGAGDGAIGRPDELPGAGAGGAKTARENGCRAQVQHRRRRRRPERRRSGTAHVTGKGNRRKTKTRKRKS